MSGGDAKEPEAGVQVSLQGLSDLWDLIREAASDPRASGSIDTTLAYALEVVRTLHVRDKTPEQRARFLEWLQRLRQQGDIEQLFERPYAFLSRDSRGGSLLGEQLLARCFEYRLEVVRSGGDPDDVIRLMIEVASALGVHEWTRGKRQALRGALSALNDDKDRAALSVLLREWEHSGSVELVRRLQRTSDA